MSFQRYLRGRVKIPTGGVKAYAFQSVTRLAFLAAGGSGVTPEPTVKVWMGEGMTADVNNKPAIRVCSAGL